MIIKCIIMRGQCKYLPAINREKEKEDNNNYHVRTRAVRIKKIGCVRVLDDVYSVDA